MSNTDTEGATDQETDRLRLLTADGRAVFFGQNSRLSAWIWFIALVSTVAITVFVAATAIRYTPTAGGTVTLHSATYRQLIDQFVSTYGSGYNYLLFVVAPIVLLFGAAMSAYLNSGLLPTGGLVMGPLFGFFVNEVGSPVAPGLVPRTVSLSDAIIHALTGAFLYGIPITVIGFIIGVVLRRVVISGRLAFR